MTNFRFFQNSHASELLAISLTVLSSGATAMNPAALGVIRNGADMVSIDFDVPRYGPLCVSVDEDDSLEFVWDEYHNLHQLPDEDAFRDCDFAEADALAAEGNPMPTGYRIEAAEVEGVTERYYACSKICASNGHKVKVCAGGVLGQANGCASECHPDRTVDVRTEIYSEPVDVTPIDFAPVGRVCRPKNGDGYSITTGVDTPESCRKRCEEDFPRCGAWEFENYALDDRECELHERSVISYSETLAMGQCQFLTESGENDDSYRCCWIAEDVVEAQTGMKTVDDVVASTYSSAPFGRSRVLAIFIPTILTLLFC